LNTKTEGAFKMNLLDRLLLTIYTLAIAFLSLLILLVPFNTWAYHQINHFIKLYYSNWQNILIPFFFLVVSLRLLFSGIRIKKSNRASGIVRHTEYGELKVSLYAIEEMAKKSARTIPAFREIRANAEMEQDGLIIHIAAMPLNDTNIPESTVLLQERIKNHIEEHTGIDVKQVKVSIDDIADYKKSRVK